MIIGSNATIYHRATNGSKEYDPEGVISAPILWDRVTIYAGAKIIGRVNIGDDVIIGANAVVLNDVPAGAVAVGFPARIVSTQLPRS